MVGLKCSVNIKNVFVPVFQYCLQDVRVTVYVSLRADTRLARDSFGADSFLQCTSVEG